MSKYFILYYLLTNSLGKFFLETLIFELLAKKFLELYRYRNVIKLFTDVRDGPRVKPIKSSSCIHICCILSCNTGPEDDTYVRSKPS
jgi:hypothetical protein